MQFTVITTDGVETVYDGGYEIKENGALRILETDQSKPVIWLSPAFWRQINQARTESSTPGVYGF